MLKKWILTFLILGIITPPGLAVFFGWSKFLKRPPQQRIFTSPSTRYRSQVRTTQPAPYQTWSPWTQPTLSPYGYRMGQGGFTYGLKSYPTITSVNFVIMTRRASATVSVPAYRHTDSHPTEDQRIKSSQRHRKHRDKNTQRKDGTKRKQQYKQSDRDGESPVTTRPPVNEDQIRRQDPSHHGKTTSMNNPQVSISSRFEEVRNRRLRKGEGSVMTKRKQQYKQSDRDGESPVTTRPPVNEDRIRRQDPPHGGKATSMNNPQVSISSRLEEVRNSRLRKGEGSVTGDLKLHCLQNRKNRSCLVGIVLVYNKEQWGTICGDTWHDGHANVVCNVLGFKTGSAIKRVSYKQKSVIKELPKFMKKINCEGDELNLTDCDGGELMVYRSCKRNKLAGVKCLGEFSESRLSCGKSTTQCRDGDRCIDQNRICNGTADCPWGTDQDECRIRAKTTNIVELGAGSNCANVAIMTESMLVSILSVTLWLVFYGLNDVQSQ